LSLQMTILATKAMNKSDTTVNSTTSLCKLIESHVTLFLSSYIEKELEQGR
jgi:hypothetical protein